MSLHFNFYASQLFCLFLFSQINLLVAIFFYTQMLDFILRSPTLQNSSFLLHLLFGELVKEIPCKSTWPVNETTPQFMQNIRFTYYARKSKRNTKIYFYKTLLMKLENMHRHYLKYFLCNIIQPNYFNSLCLNFFIELIVCNFDFFYVPKDKLIRYVTSKLSNCTYSKHWLNLRVRQPKFFKFFHVLYCW